VTRALAYVPVEELGDDPHVLVDGATRPGTVLTLSHWPQSPTPVALARDLSAQIVFAFLHAARGDPGWADESSAELRSAIDAADRAEAVTNDHFDEDGFVSVFAMTDPEAALRHEELLVDVASCGDFGVVRSRRAARIAFTIGPMAEQAVAEASGDAVGEPPVRRSGPRYRAVLERAAELLEHPEHFRQHWEQEDAFFAASIAALGAGVIQIDEVPEVDLAVVRRSAASARAPHSSGPLDGLDALGVNQVALHSATSASRILSFDEGRCDFYLRYEGWVRYMSRKVPLRPDLAPLAEELSAAEPARIRWAADGVGSIVTRMRPVPEGRTDLDPALVSGMVVTYLQSAPPAWDPFRRRGALIPSASGASGIEDR